MTISVVLAIIAGVLVSLSRQINGRLAISTSALTASFWNHIVGFVFLSAVGLVLGGLFLPGVENAPLHAYVGGALGVIFVASGSWLIARIGATNTAILVIGGQMASGVLMDIVQGTPLTYWAVILGVVMITAGVLMRGR